MKKSILQSIKTIKQNSVISPQTGIWLFLLLVAFVTSSCGSARQAPVPEPVVVAVAPTLTPIPTPTPTPVTLNLLTDDSTSVVVEAEANHVIIAAASWCPHTRSLVTALNDPRLASELSGLHLTFVFADEWNVIQEILEEEELSSQEIEDVRNMLTTEELPVVLADPEFLYTLPGDYFFATEDVSMTYGFPASFSQNTGSFDKHALEGLVEAGVSTDPLYDIYDEAEAENQ